MSSATLADLGEFELLRTVVLPILTGASKVSKLGDDCAFVELPSEKNDLVVTTDVAPRPLVWRLGHESYRTWGWYAVVVNISDLASAGAMPLVISTSVEAPPDMAVEDFREFFIGIAEASKEHGVANAGGNIRTAEKFACHGTALGLVSKGDGIGRDTARPGDLVVAIGNCGEFAAAYLVAKVDGLKTLSKEEWDVLCRPKAYIKEMSLLLRSGVLRAASDNSDGVLGAIWNIAEGSNCAIEIVMDNNTLSRRVLEVAQRFGYDPWNLAMFWGDWQVVAIIASEKQVEFEELRKRLKTRTRYLGRVLSGQPAIIGKQNGRKRRLKILRNENFIPSSFNVDVMTNVEYMLTSSLWE